MAGTVSQLPGDEGRSVRHLTSVIGSIVRHERVGSSWSGPMTVSQTTLARPAFGGRTAPILAAVIFVVGVVSGLLVAQLPLGILGPIATSGTASNPTWQLYNDFRSGE